LLIYIYVIQFMFRFRLQELIAEKSFAEKRRVTIQEVAEATDINRVTLSKLVNQHGAVVRTDVLDKLCSYFACEVGELMQHVPDD